MRHRILQAFAGCACIAVVTCSTGCRALPFCAPKGPMNQQQAQAIVHDPFPQNDIGPYEAASRPPSYQQPLPEAERVRLIPDAMPWLGR